MRVRVGMLAAVLLAGGLAGCGSNNNTATPTGTTSAGGAASSTSSSTGAEFDVGNTIEYASIGTTTELDCGDGKSLNVGGSNNTLTVKGTCASVRILGMDNKITIDKIDKDLSVGGLNNTVTYKDGSPKVSNLGSSNTVNKG